MPRTAAGLLMYGELADWFHLLTDPADYDAEAELFVRTIEEGAAREVRTVLELGSGGGNNASHLKRRFEMTLSDLSPRMLETSRRLNPECRHVEGDMRSLRLDQEFDAVFVHDAVGYMLSRADLAAAVRTAARHLRPGGVALFVPDCTRETWRPLTSHGGHDAGDRSLRYLEWNHDPDPEDDRYSVAFSYLLREGGGPVRALFEEHELGMFPRDVWVECIGEARLEPRVLPYVESSFDPPVDSCLFVGVRE